MNKTDSYITDFEAGRSMGGFQCLTGLEETGERWVNYVDVVFIDLPNGDQYYLPNGYVERVTPEGDMAFDGVSGGYDVNEKLAEVKAFRHINLDEWVKVEPIPSLEERLAEEADIEQMEREQGGAWYG